MTVQVHFLISHVIRTRIRSKSFRDTPQGILPWDVESFCGYQIDVLIASARGGQRRSIVLGLGVDIYLNALMDAYFFFPGSNNVLFHRYFGNDSFYVGDRCAIARQCLGPIIIQ